MRLPTAAILALPLVAAAPVVLDDSQGERALIPDIDFSLGLTLPSGLPGIPGINTGTTPPPSTSSTSSDTTTSSTSITTTQPPTEVPPSTTTPPSSSTTPSSSVSPSSSADPISPSVQPSTSSTSAEVSATPTSNEPSPSPEPSTSAEPTQEPSSSSSEESKPSEVVETSVNAQGVVIIKTVTEQQAAQNTNPPAKKDNGPPIGPIVGGVVGGVVALALVIGALIFALRRRRSEDEAILWPELNRHGDSDAMHALPARRTSQHGIGEKRMSIASDYDANVYSGSDESSGMHGGHTPSNFGAGAMLEYDHAAVGMPQPYVYEHEDYTTPAPAVQPGGTYEWPEGSAMNYPTQPRHY